MKPFRATALATSLVALPAAGLLMVPTVASASPTPRHHLHRQTHVFIANYRLDRKGAGESSPRYTFDNLIPVIGKYLGHRHPHVGLYENARKHARSVWLTYGRDSVHISLQKNGHLAVSPLRDSHFNPQHATVVHRPKPLN